RSDSRRSTCRIRPRVRTGGCDSWCANTDLHLPIWSGRPLVTPLVKSLETIGQRVWIRLGEFGDAAIRALRRLNLLSSCAQQQRPYLIRRLPRTIDRLGETMLEA